MVDYRIEVPGQYGGSHRKPIPENHVTIAGFDEKVTDYCYIGTKTLDNNDSNNNNNSSNSNVICNGEH